MNNNNNNKNEQKKQHPACIRYTNIIKTDQLGNKKTCSSRLESRASLSMLCTETAKLPYLS